MKKQVSVIAGASALALVVAASAAALTLSATPTTKTTLQVVAAPTATATPAAAASAQSASLGLTIAPATVAKPAALPPLDLSDMALWNWNGKWMASNWDNGSAALPWRYDHVKQAKSGDTSFTLDANGAPELQALNGTAANASGLWEAEVTLPKLKDGLIVAPLWIYNADSRDEIDFELAGRNGLDLSLHSVVNGVAKQNTVRLFAGQDLSGQRKRFGIKVDQASGYIEMYVDSVLVYRWNRSTMSFFVATPLKPFIEMWPSNPNYSGFVQWAGKWPGLAAGETLSMTVHGYKYTPLAK